MKKSIIIIALSTFSALTLVTYLLLDFDYSFEDRFKTKYVGDQVEIIVADDPEHSIPVDVISFIADERFLVALRSDLARSTPEQKGRSGSCEIHIIDFVNKRKKIVATPEMIETVILGDVSSFDEVSERFKRFGC